MKTSSQAPEDKQQEYFALSSLLGLTHAKYLQRIPARKPISRRSLSYNQEKCGKVCGQYNNDFIQGLKQETMAGLTAAFGLPYNSQLLLSGHSCCDSGTGQLPRSPQSTHVCSCQLEQVLQQKMNALPLGLFPRTNFSTDPNLIFGPTARESSAVYPPLVRQCDVKDITAGTINTAWFFNPRIDHHNFDRNRYPTCHRFGDRFSPIDLNSGARRKNATRETTSTLKAWLYEHRKNPYPTKGEKIMLAILTKMTLTQVSTWFANARRRLKKENKMTWSPRNRCGERKDSEGYSDDEDGDEDEEDNNDDLAEERENFSRKTTVIKTPQDINGFYRTDPVHSQLTSDVETLTPEQPRDQDLITPNRADQGVIWPSTRTAAETDKARTHHTISIEDSPVKSLRKWVDGCFDQNSAGTAHTPPTDTPPLTPPCATERLAEKVFHSAELEKPTPTIKNGSPQRDSEANLGQDTQRSNGQKEEGTTNREIDAALALTTLFSRNHEHK